MKKCAYILAPILIVVGVARADPSRFHNGTGIPNVIGSGRGVCWSEPPDLNGLLVSSEQILSMGLESEVANDFVPTGAIIHATWWGGFWGGTPCGSGIETPGFLIRVYTDSNCLPDAVLADLSFGPGQFTETFVGCQNVSNLPLYKWEVDLSVATAGGAVYWFGAVMRDHPYPPQAARLASAGVVNCDSAFKSAFFGFPDWTPCIDVLGIAFDASQEFTCAQSTATEPTTWGQIKGLYR